jgi:LPXTG-site transpeptidase (sortase) family protein
MTLVGVLLIGFVVQILAVSPIRHIRDQAMLYDAFRYSLANATAPVGQVDGDGTLYPLGTPVALLSIPSIGFSQVVIEGTTSRSMLAGPGHRRDTVLPGQAGASVVMGRQSTYGGPFGALDQLKVGDTIEATTGQGTSKYTVSAIRTAGSPQPQPLAAGQGRLTLVSATGISYFASGIIRVDATLTSKPTLTPRPVLLVGSLTDSEAPFASDSSAWLPLLLLLELAAVALALLTFAMRRWGRWHTWIVAIPVVLVLGSFLAEQAVILLPNLY